MRSTDPVRVRSVCQSGPRSALRRPWSPSASGVPTTTAERPSQPGRRQISARTKATKSIDSSYLRMLHHLGDYADPSSDCAGLSKDPFLRPRSTRTGRGAYVVYGSNADVTAPLPPFRFTPDRKSTRLNSSHANISYAVFCLKKKKNNKNHSLQDVIYHPYYNAKAPNQLANG